MTEAAKLFEVSATAATTAKFDTRFQKEIDLPRHFQAVLARTYVLGDYDKATQLPARLTLLKNRSDHYDDVARESHLWSALFQR